MPTLYRTVVPFAEGTMKHKDYVLRIQSILPLIKRISKLIQGRRSRRVNGRRQRITLAAGSTIALNAFILTLRIRVKNRPDKLQTILFELNPLKQELRWRHIITHDAAAARDRYDKESGWNDFEFACMHNAPVERLQHVFQDIRPAINMYLTIRWIRKEVVTGTKRKPSYDVAHHEIGLDPVNAISWEDQTYYFFEAKILS